MLLIHLFPVHSLRLSSAISSPPVISTDFNLLPQRALNSLANRLSPSPPPSLLHSPSPFTPSPPPASPSFDNVRIPFPSHLVTASPPIGFSLLCPHYSSFLPLSFLLHSRSPLRSLARLLPLLRPLTTSVPFPSHLVTASPFIGFSLLSPLLLWCALLPSFLPPSLPLSIYHASQGAPGQ